MEYNILSVVDVVFGDLINDTIENNMIVLQKIKTLSSKSHSCKKYFFHMGKFKKKLIFV